MDDEGSLGSGVQMQMAEKCQGLQLLWLLPKRHARDPASHAGDRDHEHGTR